MPAFTTKPIEFGRLPEPPKGKDAMTTATGYVFHTAEPDVNGLIEFEGKRYSFGDIEDYVTWTGDAAVRQQYDEVVASARAGE
jgi:hypothetical protein